MTPNYTSSHHLWLLTSTYTALRSSDTAGGLAQQYNNSLQRRFWRHILYCGSIIDKNFKVIAPSVWKSLSYNYLLVFLYTSVFIRKLIASIQQWVNQKSITKRIIKTAWHCYHNSQLFIYFYFRNKTTFESSIESYCFIVLSLAIVAYIVLNLPYVMCFTCFCDVCPSVLRWVSGDGMLLRYTPQLRDGVPWRDIHSLTHRCKKGFYVLYFKIKKRVFNVFYFPNVFY